MHRTMRERPHCFDVGPWTPGQWAEEAKFAKRQQNPLSKWRIQWWLNPKWARNLRFKVQEDYFWIFIIIELLQNICIIDLFWVLFLLSIAIYVLYYFSWSFFKLEVQYHMTMWSSFKILRFECSILPLKIKWNLFHFISFYFQRQVQMSSKSQKRFIFFVKIWN